MAQDKPTLLTVGSVAFDSVETPGGAVERALGGSATYASLAASYFSSPRVVAVVGDDFGDAELETFRKRAIDTSGIERVHGKTFHWRGRYHENMQDRDTLETQLNVFESFDPQVPAGFRSSAFVFLGNIAPKIQAKVLEQVEGPDLIGLDTMNFWIESALADLKAVLKRVDILFINDDEAAQLSGETQVLAAAERILDLGPRYVVIKRGEFGSLLFGRNVCLFVPAVMLPKVVDPTGAGDAFAGGFLGWLSGAGEVNRVNLAQAMLHGTVMASFTVENFSVDGLLAPDRSAIDDRRQILESMTDYV
ncbi:MAG: PfkB family carbohydrate kinase [Candidatus Krumholzibacteriia bacterium]